jgi:ribosomal protein L12E/L44/L45/RPP1/RPP2
MKQVDDLLERSKKLLQSVAFATPRKSAPAPKTDHEKEMAEIEALERQLELEISALEDVSK